MPKVKEIKKIESKIKEIKKEPADLEEEIEESEVENFANFIGGKRSHATSTLAQSEIAQQDVRERRLAKEDEEEANFRPSYLAGGNPYQGNSYTPVGAAESGAMGNKARDLGQERTLGQHSQDIMQDQSMMQMSDPNRSAGRPESSAERGYVGKQDQEKKDRRHNM